MNHEDFLRACEFAFQKHRGHRRKQSRSPYIIHPMRVACNLLDLGYSYEMATVAVLHDTVEDTNTTEQEITENFSRRVCQIVVELSEKRFHNSPLNDEKNWFDRKSATLKKLKNCSREALIIACADKLDNLQCVHREMFYEQESPWRKFNAPYEKQSWYYRTLLQIFTNRQKEFDERELLREFTQIVTTLFEQQSTQWW